MKLFILILFFSINTFAGTWINKSDLAAKKIDLDLVIKYPTKKRDCSGICFNIAGHDIRKIKAGLVDDPSNPKFLKKGIVDCTDLDACRTELENIDCTVFKKDTFAFINQEITEVYCAEPNGFNQMDGLVPDAAGILQAGIDDVQKASDKATRDTAKGPRITLLDQCIQDTKNPTLTPEQTKNCLQALVREIRGESVPVGDL